MEQIDDPHPPKTYNVSKVAGGVDQVCEQRGGWSV